MIEKLEKNETVAIKTRFRIPSAGTGAFKIVGIYERQNETGILINVQDWNNRIVGREDVVYPFFIASKEELYQKYSVIVAIWTSIIAIIISTISFLATLLK